MDTTGAAHILFIDDSPADYHLFLESLKLINYDGQVEWLDDGEDAMNLLMKINRPPDLIILDINLPRINGHTILQYLKSDRDKKKIPVIIFSSSDRRADIDSSYANHANGYVVKPDKLDDYVKFAEVVTSFWLGIAALSTVRFARIY